MSKERERDTEREFCVIYFTWIHSRRLSMYVRAKDQIGIKFESKREREKYLVEFAFLSTFKFVIIVCVCYS